MNQTMFRNARVIAALACASALATTVATAALASSSEATAAAPTTSSAFPRCVEPGLSVGLHGHQALVANRGFILTLTNTSNTECVLDGYPGLGIEDAAHHVMPSRTHWGSTYFNADPGPKQIVLSPGETASADFAFATGAGSQATYLEVTPPNAFRHLTIKIPGAPVQIVGGRLFVTAMARHTPYNT
jgi:hypothetical protein